MPLTSIDDAAWATPWRHRRVGEKALLSGGLVLTAATAPAWPGTLLVSAVALGALVGPARIRPATLARVMAAPLLFVIVGAASVAVRLGAAPVAADPGWQWGPVGIGPDGLRQAVALLGHGVAGALAVMVLAATTPMVDLVTWGRRWRIPDALLEIASLTYRLVWVLLATATAIRRAQTARLGDAAPLPRRLRATADAMGSVLVRAWHQSLRLEQGLAGRGYESSLTTLAPRRAASWPFVAVSTLCLALIWLLVAWSGAHHG